MTMTTKRHTEMNFLKPINLIERIPQKYKKTNNKQINLLIISILIIQIRYNNNIQNG